MSAAEIILAGIICRFYDRQRRVGGSRSNSLLVQFDNGFAGKAGLEQSCSV